MFSSREGNLAAALLSKDEEPDSLVRQHTKEIEDKHKVALEALSSESIAQLKKVADDLAAASTTKTNLDQQVSKMTEELAESTNATAALKGEAQKVEICLKDVQS